MTFLDSLLQPILVVNVDGVAAEAATLSSQGPTLAASGATVHSTWQGLSEVYVAPEAPTLFAATLPIQTDMAALGPEVATVGAALTAFATEVRTLQTEARALIAEAAALEAQIQSDASAVAMAGGDSSAATTMAGPEMDRLRTAAAALMARFNQAEITCANQIRALAGGAPLVANNGDDVLAPNEYGLTAGQWFEAWGGTWLNRDPLGGIATAATGDFEGLVGLVTGDPNTWLGLWHVVANAIPGVTIANNYMDLPGLPRGAASQALLEVGKGMLAWDEWQRNPGNAFGQVLYNFGTLPLAVGKIGTAGRLGGAAARLGETALRGLDAAAAATRVRVTDLAQAARTSLADLRVPTSVHINPVPALAGVGRLPGPSDVTVGTTRVGDMPWAQRMGIVTDPSRGGHGPSSDGTPDHLEGDPQSSRGGDDTPGNVTPEHHDGDHTDTNRTDTDRPDVDGGDSSDGTSSKPEWLRNRERGNEFNRQREPYYTERGGANEVHVGERSAKRQFPRVDSYVPGEEIVSRKHTQLSEVQDRTAISYLNEFVKKYGRGTIVANTPSNKRDLGVNPIGKPMDGELVLEVPVQTGNPPVPRSVLEAAEDLGITIRDEKGNTYELPDDE
jgi:hypothetical protein